ncbi:MAG: HAMP domain-containing histidine kinase [Lachnospiraceae bacterium]|nr:HAMP domain-containing histidine kinase [Lachnospiraceae bacterium]
MKELRRKTAFTLILILSLILIAVMVLLNVRTYADQKEEIRRNLDVLENKKEMREPGAVRPLDEPEKTEGWKMKPRDMENVMILDHEIYIVEIKEGEITEVFNSGNTSDDFDVYAAAEEIIAKEEHDRMYAADLYFSNYSYKYDDNESIVIMNNKEVKQKLWTLLAESLLLTVLAEVSIVVLSRIITKWITGPAEEAFERQKEFIADASHELKTPLAVIMASADEIQSPDIDPKYIDNIRYESDRMNRLITGLLNLSRLESGEDIVSFKEEDLSRILEKTCMAYEAVAFEQGVSVQTDIEEGLLCKCNKEEIEQMAATLLDNAVRHSYQDSTVKVLASSGKGKGNIDIQIINFGDPIPKEDEERIFERFYRGDRARNREENRYGLGLAIARRIARNHNGDIKAHSENGETVFRVTLRK